MEELTESARQCLVSQGIIIGALSVINSLGLFTIGVIVITRAKDILHFTSLIHLAILEIACGSITFLTVIYIWWILVAYRNRQLEVRSKYLDENMSRALKASILPIIFTFAALVVSAVFLLLKVDTSSTYDLKTAMSLYSTDVTRKVIMDKVQILLECCGSLSLLDWFLVDWQNADLEPGVHLQNVSFADWDSVPYSCCCQEAPPPCVHHQLRAFGVGSLYISGCADKLDGAVFFFVLKALIMFFISTFLNTLLLYTARKIQTSVRSAILKGDATAPGCWWIICPPNWSHMAVSDDFHPLLEKTCPTPKVQLTKQINCTFRQTPRTLSPFLTPEIMKKRQESISQEWNTYISSRKNQEMEFSEDWTRMANDASGSTSGTSLLTSTRPTNSTSETRHSVSDTAVANVEVLHHFEHKVRPLYRT